MPAEKSGPFLRDKAAKYLKMATLRNLPEVTFKSRNALNLSDFVTRFPSTYVKKGELLSLIFIFIISENYWYPFLVCKAGPHGNH